MSPFFSTLSLGNPWTTSELILLHTAVGKPSDPLKEGMVIAVEPMLTLGSPRIYVHDNNWTVDTMDHSPSAHFEHTVVVTADGYKILTGE